MKFWLKTKNGAVQVSGKDIEMLRQQQKLPDDTQCISIDGGKTWHTYALICKMVKESPQSAAPPFSAEEAFMSSGANKVDFLFMADKAGTQNEQVREILEKIYKRLERDRFNFKSEIIDGLDVIVATKSQFKLSALATQMNTFAVIGVSEHITQDSIENFTKAAIQHALNNNKGLPRGMQSGIVCFATLISPNVEDNAKKWAEKKPKKHFAAFEMPVIIDLENNGLHYCKKTPIFGMMYYKSFRGFIEKALNPSGS